MKNSEFRILLIDDDEDDYVHIRDLLTEVHSTKYTIFWESSYEGGLKAIRELSFDACLLDYKLGEKSGLDLLIEAKKRSFTYPIILLTGLGDFDLDVKAMESGASDYLVKDQLTGPLLERSVRYSIKQAHDMEELKQIKAQVIQQERLASLGLLASSLAHEIGTPLGIIRSRAELAQKRSPDNPTVQDNVLVTITQIDRITKLVNSLLHLARGGKSDHTTTVELDRVIDDVLNLLEHEFGRKGILLKKEIVSNCRLRITASLMEFGVKSIFAIPDPYQALLSLGTPSADSRIDMVFIGLDFEEEGLHLITQIMADPTLSHLPIVLIQNHATPAQLTRAYKMGAVGKISIRPKKSELRAVLSMNYTREKKAT